MGEQQQQDVARWHCTLLDYPAGNLQEGIECRLLPADPGNWQLTHSAADLGEITTGSTPFAYALYAHWMTTDSLVLRLLSFVARLYRLDKFLLRLIPDGDISNLSRRSIGIY